jgi:hypothetical protein
VASSPVRYVTYFLINMRIITLVPRINLGFPQQNDCSGMWAEAMSVWERLESQAQLLQSPQVRAIVCRRRSLHSLAWPRTVRSSTTWIQAWFVARLRALTRSAWSTLSNGTPASVLTVETCGRKHMFVSVSKYVSQY